jgi:curved DNA-binding protein CbpA
MTDYYELLQISPNADSDTIHRVYRYLAARLHPDNARTGDAERFQQVKSAYDVLSSPMRRREYDGKRKEFEVRPLSTSIDFMDQLEGETNRRMAVLAVLYYRRRTHANNPDVTMADIEERMGFPRDYLDFTLWYLVKKKYIAKADNASYSLTAEGVDFIEKERLVRPVLNGLLTSDAGSTNDAPHGTSQGSAGATAGAAAQNPSAKFN